MFGGCGASKCCPISVLSRFLIPHVKGFQMPPAGLNLASDRPRNRHFTPGNSSAAGCPLPSLSPLPPFSPSLSSLPPPFSSCLACLHACPRGSMEHQEAPMHEAWPDLQVSTCMLLHPPGHLHGTVAGDVVGQLARPEVMEPVVAAGIESWTGDHSVGVGSQAR